MQNEIPRELLYAVCLSVFRIVMRCDSIEFLEKIEDWLFRNVDLLVIIFVQRRGWNVQRKVNKWQGLYLRHTGVSNLIL